MTRWRLVIVALAVAATASAQEPESVAKPGFPVYLWVDANAVPTQALFEACLGFGITGVSLEAGQDPRPWVQAGFRFYIDQVIGRDLLQVDPKSYEAAIRLALTHPDRAPSRPSCLRDPAVRALATQALLKLKKTLHEATPDFISFRDEPSFTRFINPSDWCGCPRCELAFLPYVIERHAGRPDLLETLGVARTPLEARTRLRIPTTDEARAAFYKRIPPRSPAALVPWNDARAFADATFVDFLQGLSTQGREIFPGIPTGILGAQMPAAFGGYDWNRLLGFLDIIEPYDLGGTPEIVNSLRREGSRMLHTYFPSKDAPAVSVAELYRRFIAGDDGAILYASGDVFAGNHPEQPSDWIREFGKHLVRLQGPEFKAFSKAQPIRAEIAILTSLPTTRLHWMRDSEKDGKTWPRRLSSIEEEESTDARTRVAWIGLLSDLGFAPSIVTAGDLEAASFKDLKLRALVLPRALAMSDREVTTVRGFIEQGGVVIADGPAAAFDEDLRERPTPGLDAAFGIRRRSNDESAGGLDPIDGPPPYPLIDTSIAVAKGIAAAHPSGTPVGVRLRHERGGASLLLNLDIRDYERDRDLGDEQGAALRTIVREFLKSQGVTPCVAIKKLEGSCGMPLLVRVRDDDVHRYIAIALDPGFGTYGKTLPASAADATAQFECTGLEAVRLGGPLGARTASPVAATRWTIDLTHPVFLVVPRPR